MTQMRSETKPWIVSSFDDDANGVKHRGRKSLTACVECPFCGAMAKLHLWSQQSRSLGGHGKLCECGAKFISGGRCIKLVQYNEDKP